MIAEGFYRIKLDAYPGIGCCRHDRTWVSDEPYEIWSIMYVRASPGERRHPMFTTINSGDRSYAALEIGKRIPGLPHYFGPIRPARRGA